MIIPIGIEDHKVQRFPLVTVSLMIACIVTLLATTYLNDAARVVDSQIDSVLGYLEAHPYLEPSPELRDTMIQCWGEKGTTEYLTDLRAVNVVQPYPDQKLVEQRELNQRTQNMLASMDAQPATQWGLIPGDPSIMTLLTHMFLHGGLLHLIGNMLFLFLAGPLVEDRWGRLFFLGFYLLSGLVAGGAHILRYPDSMIPLVGASGAIAGAMGAFLFRFWKRRIRFFYYFGFFIRGTFLSPAWLMLPLWLAGQVASAMLIEHLGLVGGGGVAYWAHIGGFIFGSMFALAMVSLGIEQKILGLPRDARIGSHPADNTVIDRAMEANASGDGARAFGMLSQEYRRHPSNVDVGLAMWEVALDNDWQDRAAPVMLRVIHEELSQDQVHNAVDHWEELCNRIQSLNADPGLLVRVGRLLTDGGLENYGRQAFKLAFQQSEERLTAATALKIAQTLKDIDRNLAREAAEAALRHSNILPDEETQATALLRDISGTKSA